MKTLHNPYFCRLGLAALICCICVWPAHARERIKIVGSSQVLDYARAVSENFSLHFQLPAPSMEFTGTGAGFRLFCKGVGFEHPDIIITPRRMSAQELAQCRQSGVDQITEIPIGKDAIAMVNSVQARQYDFTLPQVFTALAESIERDGKVVPNTIEHWREIDSSLPDAKIKVMGPPLDSGTYDALYDLILTQGCKPFNAIRALDESNRRQICHSMRRDGAYLTGSKNEMFIIRWLKENPHAFGIANAVLLMLYPGAVAGNAINGVMPTLENISSGKYPLSRPVYVYVKTKHVTAINGLQRFLYEFTSERAIGPDGYLVEKGFLPLDDIGRNHARDLALSLETLETGN